MHWIFKCITIQCRSTFNLQLLLIHCWSWFGNRNNAKRTNFEWKHYHSLGFSTCPLFWVEELYNYGLVCQILQTTRLLFCLENFVSTCFLFWAKIPFFSFHFRIASNEKISEFVLNERNANLPRWLLWFLVVRAGVGFIFSFIFFLGCCDSHVSSVSLNSSYSCWITSEPMSYAIFTRNHIFGNCEDWNSNS